MTAKAKNHMSGKRVRITDLKEITKGMENIIIKSDCEGEEHSIFNEEADLDNIYKMQIEYHKGVQALPKILQEKGFRIRIQKVANTILSGEVGWIYALKQKKADRDTPEGNEQDRQEAEPKNAEGGA